MRGIFIGLFPLFFFSCDLGSHLRQESLEWQPYEEGDILVFETSLGPRDTILVTEISRQTNPIDPLNPFAGSQQTLRVFGQINLRRPFVSAIGEVVTHENMEFLMLESGQDADYLFLKMDRPRDTIDWPTLGLTIPELDSLHSRTKEDGGVSLEIAAHEFYNQPNSDDLTTYTWNKRFGLIGYKLDNGDSSQLIGFLRNGTNLLDNPTEANNR